jgi:ferredoxin
MSVSSQRWRLTIDSARCTGHGRCYSVAPDLFDCDDEGFGRVVADEVDAPGERIEECIAICPESAISATPAQASDRDPPAPSRNGRPHAVPGS